MGFNSAFKGLKHYCNSNEVCAFGGWYCNNWSNTRSVQDQPETVFLPARTCIPLR